MSFENKVVIVTGASSGIGAAFAVKFAGEGAKVVLVGRNAEKLNNVAQKCGILGSRLVIVADVSNDEDARRIIEQTITHFGQIDVLVNNAGVGALKQVLDEGVMEDYDKVMNINLRSVVYLIHLASKYLIETKGSIINITSVAAEVVLNSTYSTSKAALEHFTRNVAAELAPKGVRVNAISPGPTATDLLDNMGVEKSHQQAVLKAIIETTALKRLSDAEEMADMGLYLASDKARGITGSSFNIDNGYLIIPRV